MTAVTTTWMTPAEINAKLEVPPNSSTPVKPVEAEFMYRLVRQHGLKRTLETGMGYGRSAAHIICANEGEPHIAMDPFQTTYGSGGLKNIERLGLSSALDFRADYSHNVLPKLLAEGRQFDFAFIDGDHRFDGQFIDFYYVDLLLPKNGFVLLHDTWMRSTAFLMKYIEKNRTDYRKVDAGLRNLALYRKTGTDERAWTHFSAFYTPRAALTQRAAGWLNAGADTALKRMVRGVRSRLG